MRHASPSQTCLEAVRFSGLFLPGNPREPLVRGRVEPISWTYRQGTVETDQLPLQWSEEQNIEWKTAIHDKGWSSPIVCQDKIWMTTASEDGRKLYVIVVKPRMEPFCGTVSFSPSQTHSLPIIQ